MQSYEEITALKVRLEKENVYLQDEIRTEHNFEEIVGNSPALLGVLHKVEQVAPTDSTVLICGETGTGKELIARAIHDRSARKGRPLVKVDCSAISAGLVESELFGHVKGAFTGALERHIGRIELADGGTILLDEVGELPPETSTAASTPELINSARRWGPCGILATSKLARGACPSSSPSSSATRTRGPLTGGLPVPSCAGARGRARPRTAGSTKSMTPVPVGPRSHKCDFRSALKGARI